MTMNYGTDQYNPKASLRGGILLEKTNLFGRGIDVGTTAQADIKKIRKLEAHFSDQHIFDSDVSFGAFIYKRNDDFDQWKSVTETPNQRVTGANLRFGFLLPEIARRFQLVAEFGFEHITNNHPKATPENAIMQPIIDRTFQSGNLNWVGLELSKDTRNHQVYPTEGIKAALSTRLAAPGFNSQFSFFKCELEGSYYRSLIDDDNLVLCLHARGGRISKLSETQPVPYKELFHMGGQSTVRGFVWGGIGPSWVTGDPLGAQNAIQLNTELIFPLIPDYSMKAHFFYDAGAGWDTPKERISDRNKIMRDKFNMRHTVGFGLNLMKPVPAKIDWGFKLDRKKNLGESASEFHLSMNYAW
jgi:outer membrane protein insertion porin family